MSSLLRQWAKAHEDRGFVEEARRGDRKFIVPPRRERVFRPRVGACVTVWRAEDEPKPKIAWRRDAEEMDAPTQVE